MGHSSPAIARRRAEQPFLRAAQVLKQRACHLDCPGTLDAENGNFLPPCFAPSAAADEQVAEKKQKAAEATAAPGEGGKPSENGTAAS